MIKAIIDLDAILNNARRIAQKVSPARVMAVVKANSYGHGAVRVAHMLKEAGFSFFAVATIAEALELRDAGIDDPILVSHARNGIEPHGVNGREHRGVDPDAHGEGEHGNHHETACSPKTPQGVPNVT
jgi:hypothetical protein